MPKRIHAPTSRGLGPENDSRILVLCFGFSLLAHLLFIGAVAFMPSMAPKRRLPPGAINVTLVSLPGPRSAAPSSEIKKPRTPVAVQPPHKPPPAASKAPKEVSLAPAKKSHRPKRSLKKKTLDRQKMIDTALNGVKKKVEKAQTDSVRQALERLKKKVEQTEGSPKTTAGGQGIAPGGSAVGGGGRRALELIDIYRVEVAFQVERHWAFSEQLAGGDHDLETRLVFKVLPDGEITDIRFTKRSGNRYLDESAYKAIVKANPVSPHPPGVRRPSIIVALRFTPEGLRK